MLEKKLQSYTDKLTKTEEKIKKQLLKENMKLLGESISKFSARGGVTPSSVTKYLDKVGLRGWKFLQTYLSMTISSSNYRDLDTDEKIGFFQNISKQYFMNNSKIKLRKIVEENILNVDIVYVVAEGQTFYQASYLSSMLNKLGVVSMAISYTESTSKRLNKSAILLSLSGYNDYIMWFYDREKIEKVILLSHFHHNSNKKIKTAIIGNESLSNREEKFLPLTSKLSMDIMIHDILCLIEEMIVDDENRIIGT